MAPVVPGCDRVSPAATAESFKLMKSEIAEREAAQRRGLTDWRVTSAFFR